MKWDVMVEQMHACRRNVDKSRRYPYSLFMQTCSFRCLLPIYTCEVTVNADLQNNLPPNISCI
jgi:hypothetical protein